MGGVKSHVCWGGVCFNHGAEEGGLGSMNLSYAAARGRRLAAGGRARFWALRFGSVTPHVCRERAREESPGHVSVARLPFFDGPKGNVVIIFVFNGVVEPRLSSCHIILSASALLSRYRL